MSGSASPKVAKAAKKPGQRRVSTATVLQMEAVECGAASLAMILAYHGRWVALEELRIACGVGRDGSKASNLCRAARGYGLSAKGFRKEPSGLAELPVPSIIHWNFNHYVVFEGYSGAWAYLNDPAVGRRRVTREELSDAFTGVVLAFERTPDFKTGGAPARPLLALARALGSARGALVLIALLTLALVVPAVVIPAFGKIFVDEILVEEREAWLKPLILAMAGTAALRGLTTWLQQKILLRVEMKLSLVMATRLLEKVLALPIAFFAQRAPGDLANRVGAADRVAKLLTGDFAASVLNALTASFLGLVMIGYDPVLAGLTIAAAGANFAVLRATARIRRTQARRLMNEMGKLTGATVGAIRSIETIKASGLEQDGFATWSGYQAKILNTGREIGRVTAVIDLFPPLLSSLTAAAVLCVGALRVIDGHLTVGDLVAFQTLSASFMTPIGALVGFGNQIQRITADLARIEDIERYPAAPAPASDDDRAVPVKLRGEVELRGVTFGYSPLDPPLIDRFDLQVKPGRRVALVGASGSGKSTIGRIVAGLLPLSAGEVLLDGRPLRTIPRSVLAGSLAYVDQEIFLFEGTIRDNVTLWDSTIADNAVTRALADAAILDDVSRRAGGIEAEVSEAGTNFSGGQRQRLEIARALALEPTLVILDEATAALDPLTEKLIDDNLRRRGITCIIIAHRLSTIRDCDEIIVLRRGKVVERGGHEALLAAGGEYARLIETT